MSGPVILCRGKPREFLCPGYVWDGPAHAIGCSIKVVTDHRIQLRSPKGRKTALPDDAKKCRVENFWSLLNRDVGGTYISVEPFYLFRYVDEPGFSFNTRKHADGEIVSDYERFKTALSQIVGRRASPTRR